MALGISSNPSRSPRSSRLTRHVLTGLAALTAVSLSACYPELYSENDPYLAEIEAAQEGVDHGAGHNEKERGEKKQGEDGADHGTAAADHGTEGH